jgi:hypothetical protein
MNGLPPLRQSVRYEVMLLDAVVGVVAGLLVIAGILVMLGPQAGSLLRRLRSIRRPQHPLAGLQAAKSRERVPPGINPKTQRVILAAARLATWLRAHGHDDSAREVRAAAARLAGDEAAGLYAMHSALRRLRAVSFEDAGSRERLRLLSADLHRAVQDRFEQLELLPFRRP